MRRELRTQSRECPLCRDFGAKAARDTTAAGVLDIMLRSANGNLAVGKHGFRPACMTRKPHSITSAAAFAREHGGHGSRGRFNLRVRRAAKFDEAGLALLPRARVA